MKRDPAVSVCMPVYNAERYLAQAVESVLSQSFADFEFNIIDDGSTDGSLEVLREFERLDSRIRLVSRPNRGIANTRNELLRMARAELIATADADDITLPDRLAAQVEFLRTHEDVVCVGGGIFLIDHKGRRIAPFMRPADDATLQREALAGRLLLPQPCAMMRRAAVERIGLYDEASVAEDVDFFLRLGEVGKLANLQKILVMYRVHEGSISERCTEAQLASARSACERAWARRGIAGRFEADSLPRPTAQRRSRHEFITKYGWWAFTAGERRTALVYGWKAISLLPWNMAGWRLLVCTMIKPVGQKADLGDATAI